MIDRFQGKYYWLSNFYPSPIDYKGIIYPTVENAYQRAKLAKNHVTVHDFALLTPNEAKRLGRELDLRPDWDDVKYDVMLECCCLKFQTHNDLAKRLLATKDAELIEGNHWGDIYWGVCRGIGENNLGKILMSIREDLRENS
ncbi:MAG: NADAR family protein [Reinekea sp.]|nr:NADAR family protein [Reinekea sp.]